ncbi:MAG TPA: biotin/lipoyl-binding protein [Terriglobales bacterium]|nr:biotin/lipoyl-binding protein [Terriglobales bacterium]
MSALPESPRETSSPGTDSAATHAKPRMSTRNRLLFFFTAWLIVLMPFLFWWNTWFGRQLSDQQLREYLRDDKKPRHIQHALVQIGERVIRHDDSVTRWYPDVVRLASHPIEEVRNTDAWVMGQDASSKDASSAGFHEVLLQMLNDGSLMVRGNAALSLVRFSDTTGRPQIIALLQPAKVLAPLAGKITDSSTVGTMIHQGGIIAKIENAGQTMEARSPISGRLRDLSVKAGQTVAAGDEMATLDPGTEQVWEALRALYLVGRSEDLPTVRPYERELPEISDHVRKQAVETEQAIRERAK